MANDLESGRRSSSILRLDYGRSPPDKVKRHTRRKRNRRRLMNILTRSSGEPDFIAGDHGIRSRCRPRTKPTGKEGGGSTPSDPRPFVGHHEVIDSAVPRNVVIQRKEVLDLERIAHKIIVGAGEVRQVAPEIKPARIRPTQRIVKPIGVAVVALAEAGGLDHGIGSGEAP